jgi:hypothetical protein
MMSVAEASNSIEQAKHGGDHSSRAAQLQARENEQKALSLWIKGATFQQIAAAGLRVGIAPVASRSALSWPDVPGQWLGRIKEATSHCLL